MRILYQQFEVPEGEPQPTEAELHRAWAFFLFICDLTVRSSFEAQPQEALVCPEKMQEFNRLAMRRFK